MLDRLVANREFTQVEAHHFRLDFYLIELLPRVDANHAADHFRDYDHVSQMSFDQVGFLVGLGFLLGFAKLFNQTHRLTLEAAVESTTSASVDDIAKLFGREVE